MIKSSLKILRKSSKNYEVIAVDDGCPDKSGNVARKFTKKIKKKHLYIKKLRLWCCYKNRI